MANYFRITTYHPTENLLIIMDSNGLFDKLWQFSSYMVSKGLKIIEAGDEDKFDEGDIPKVERNNVYIIVRACKSGMSNKENSTITVDGKSYTIL